MGLDEWVAGLVGSRVSRVSRVLTGAGCSIQGPVT